MVCGELVVVYREQYFVLIAEINISKLQYTRHCVTVPHQWLFLVHELQHCDCYALADGILPDGIVSKRVRPVVTVYMVVHWCMVHVPPCVQCLDSTDNTKAYTVTVLVYVL